MVKAMPHCEASPLPVSRKKLYDKRKKEKQENGFTDKLKNSKNEKTYIVIEKTVKKRIDNRKILSIILFTSSN